MAELVDARDSKSRFFGSMGSIPIAGTPSLDVVGIGFSPSLGAFSENSSWPSIALKMHPNAGGTGA